MKKKSYFFLTALLLATMPAWGQKFTYQKGDKVETDEGVFIVTGDNLISNPSFDEGTTGWKAGDGTVMADANWKVVESGGADGGAYLQAQGGAGSGSPKSLRTGWQIEPNKMYLFSCWQYRTTNSNNNSQYSFISLGTSETAGDTYAKLNFTLNKWVQTEIVFSSQSATWCVANFRWLDKGISFDCFTLAEVEMSDEIVTARLEEAISKGWEALDNTEEGDGKGQYTAEVRAELEDILSEAEDVLDDPADQQEVNEMVTIVNDAVTAYYDKVNPPFSTEKKYNIVHTSGYYLSSGGSGGTVKIVADDVTDETQIFTFCPTPANAAATGYNLKDGQGNFVYRSGSWDTKASPTQSLTEKNAIFQVVDLGTGLVQLKNMGSGSVLGTDGNSNGSTVYSNKNGTDGKNCWTLVEYVPADERDDRFNYEALLAKAQKEYDAINISMVGTRVFMYSPAAYNAYGAAIAASQQMDDYSDAYDYLEEAMATFAAEAVNQPDATTPFVITQSSGMAMAYDEAQTLVAMHTPDYGEAQQFLIVPTSTAGAFGLKNVSSGKYVAKSGSSAWDTTWADDCSATTAQWIISVYDDHYYTLQNAAGKGYMGSDATADGSALYCDKGASAVNSHWTINECSVAGMMDEIIAKAELLAATTPVGTDYTSVPQSAMDALQKAIEEAREARESLTTVEEAQDAVAELQSAIDTFNQSFNPLEAFESGAFYRIVHSGGCVLTYTASGNATITTFDPDAGPTSPQTMTLEAVAGQTDTYYIKSVASGRYLAASGDYNSVWQTSNASAATFVIEHLDGCYLGLRNTSKAYFGTDLGSNGSSVYSDKAANNSMAYWTIESIITWDYTAFDAAAAAADTFGKGMTEGWRAGEYFSQVVSDFLAAVSTLKSESKTAVSQEDLDYMTEQMEALVTEYAAKANATDQPEEWLATLAAACRAEAEGAKVGIEKGQYPQEAMQDFLNAIAAAEGATSDFAAAIEALDAARATFHASVNTVDRDALTNAINAANAALATAVAGNYDGQYPQEAIDAYQSALNEVITTRTDPHATQSDIDTATNRLKAAAATFASQKVVINFTTLNNLIKQATKTVSDNQKYLGSTAGCYTQDAFDELNDIIEEAKTYAGAKDRSQSEVDEMAATLQDAIDTFVASRLPFDTSALKTLLDTAYALLEQMGPYMSAEDIEELQYAITVGEDALTATEQSVIDRAVKILSRDCKLIDGIYSAIENAKMGQASDARFFSLDGREVTKVSRGFYIMQMDIDGASRTRKVFVK